MDHQGEEKAPKLENEKADQQLSGIPQLSSSNINTMKDQLSLISYWIAKIEDDFDVIDYFFSNPYKYSATSMLKPQFYKDAEACKKDSSQCNSIKDSSADNLSSVSSKALCLLDEESVTTLDSDYLKNSHDNVIDTSVTYDDFSVGSEYDFDPYHDDIMFHASRSGIAAPRRSIHNVKNNKCDCDSSKVLCSHDDPESWVTFDFDYLEK